MKKILFSAASALLLLSCTSGFNGKYTDFRLCGEFLASEGDAASILFALDAPGTGYEVVFRNGSMDGSVKSGSLAHVRNLYRSLAADGQWCPFEIVVNGKRIAVSIDGQEVVNYIEPLNPYRKPEYEGMKLAEGSIKIVKGDGNVKFRKLRLSRESAEHAALSAVQPDESSDPVIRLQQEDFPVIDWHVHLKGGLTKEMALSMQMAYGINYGVAPNAGEGGVGEMLSSDREVYEYFEKVKDSPFLRGVQGEGRRWTGVFSQEALSVFDYLFTDAMTIVDHKGRITRLYRPEEVIFDGLDEQAYMNLIVDQTVKILCNEPADFFANAFYLPDCMAADYSVLWTDERVNRVLDVMEENGIALEISARYGIPGERIIRMAKDRGLKFVFGTNNADADFGRLEYSLAMAEKCGIGKDDLWFPTMSTRSARKPVIYNVFSKDGARISLFNGTDLEGWIPVFDGEEDPFSVYDGNIAVAGKPFGYLRTAQKYSDYKLHAEWRWVGEGSNSGIFQRVQDDDKVWPEAVECQLKAGCAGDLVCLGGARIEEIPYDPDVAFPVKKRETPDAAIELSDGSGNSGKGEWNRAEIICRGREMLVYINGSFQNRATLGFEEGYIALQSEGGPLEFRNVYVEPVE